MFIEQGKPMNPGMGARTIFATAKEAGLFGRGPGEDVQYLDMPNAISKHLHMFA